MFRDLELASSVILCMLQLSPNVRLKRTVFTQTNASEDTHPRDCLWSNDTEGHDV